MHGVEAHLLIRNIGTEPRSNVFHYTLFSRRRWEVEVELDIGMLISELYVEWSIAIISVYTYSRRP